MDRRLTPRVAGILISATLALITLSPTNTVSAQTSTANAPSGADLVLLQRVLSQLGIHPVINADFLQTRTSPLLTTPAITRGKLVFAREHGVIWQVQAPHPQCFIYGRTRSARLDAEGNVLSLDTQPSAITQQVTEWSNALMRGDTSGLASQFTATVNGTLNQWQVVLTPTQPQIAQAVKRLTLAGDTVVRSALLETRRGESIKWQFDKVRTADQPDAREQRLFKVVE
ncbi:outer membrane lipoprotein carrier protein LolA [Pandoraea sp. ISTKB]|uniref:outer membrane lipoprotein carrier protein LolA n=1 Tax=Pandoraea sp. ISTKB TaxID=1586708 RepID=UPI0008471FE1|nr:outer membrane lipoprotein carrier protein LolA [Pandoraea sp. ISTKB]ODP32537.1 hypothetical protein A9762_22545 [Pandoraea sp. ISTKB]